MKQLARALNNNGQEQAADAFSGEGEDGRSLKMEIDEDSINHDREKSNDSVDNEMARMFNEDCGELEEIFGLKDVAEAHDPLISRILQEIKQSNLSKRPSSANRGEKIHPANRSLIKASASRPPDARRAPPQPRHGAGQHVQIPARPTDLSKSLWPCELYRQKRKLSHCLSCLVDEDYRWLDVFKWQFEFLFGEDSDDEFAHCSPTIELDEVLIGSCVRRITPWIVRHLMPPMRDGLISNRFLFKKLAKQLSRAIILVNQYPGKIPSSIHLSLSSHGIIICFGVLQMNRLSNMPLRISSAFEIVSTPLRISLKCPTYSTGLEIDRKICTGKSPVIHYRFYT